VVKNLLIIQTNIEIFVTIVIMLIATVFWKKLTNWQLIVWICMVCVKIVSIKRLKITALLLDWNNPANPVSEAKYCYREVVFYTFDKKEGFCTEQCKCTSDSDKDCSDLYEFLSPVFDDCCYTKEKLKAAGILKVEDVCQYFYEKVEGCCRILQQGNEALFRKVQRFKNNMASCKEVFNIGELKKSLDNLLNNIKDEYYSLGVFYYELLKNQLKNIKTFWENRDRCSF